MSIEEVQAKFIKANFESYKAGFDAACAGMKAALDAMPQLGCDAFSVRLMQETVQRLIEYSNEHYGNKVNT